METGAFVELISALGFPIACVIALGAFVFTIYKNTTKENKENMEKVQARCKEREEKLYEEIKENRQVIAQSIATLQSYADNLEVIRQDVGTIKNDINILMSK